MTHSNNSPSPKLETRDLTREADGKLIVDHVSIKVFPAEVMAVADPLDAEALEPGARCLVQLRSAEPLACMPGDRLILRRESPVITVGGGEVIDPWAPRVRRRDAPRAVAFLRRLLDGDRLAFLERAGPAGLDAAAAAERLGGDLERAVALGGARLSPAQVEALERLLVEALGRWHAENPLASGAGRRVLHRGRLAALDGAAYAALLERAAAAGRIVIDGPRIRLPGWEVRLSPEQRRAEATLRRRLSDAGLEALPAAEAVEGLADGEALVALLVERGEIVRLGARLLLGAHTEQLVAAVRALLAERGRMTPGDFKELTGLSRRTAIPLLEWLDARGVTVRSGDARVARHSGQRGG